MDVSLSPEQGAHTNTEKTCKSDEVSKCVISPSRTIFEFLQFGEVTNLKSLLRDRKLYGSSVTCLRTHDSGSNNKCRVSRHLDECHPDGDGLLVSALRRVGGVHLHLLVPARLRLLWGLRSL